MNIIFYIILFILFYPALGTLTYFSVLKVDCTFSEIKIFVILFWPVIILASFLMLIWVIVPGILGDKIGGIILKLINNLKGE